MQESPPSDEPDSLGTRAPEPTRSGAGDEVIERAQDLLAEIESELGRIETALSHLETGSYGSCEVCGTPIAAELLAQHPARSLCADHVEERTPLR